MGRLTRLVAAGQMTIGSVGVGARHVAKLVERVRGDISGLQVTSDESDHHALALGDYDPRTCLLEERSKGGALRSDVEERREHLFVDEFRIGAAPPFDLHGGECLDVVRVRVPKRRRVLVSGAGGVAHRLSLSQRAGASTARNLRRSG